jgi:hypothetical protein
VYASHEATVGKLNCKYVSHCIRLIERSMDERMILLGIKFK